MSQTKRIVAAIDDLFFMVKVNDAAKAVGLQVEFARSKDDALKRVQSAPKSCLAVVDLNAGQFGPIGLVAELKTLGVEVLAFLSHVNAELKLKAEEAGADRVLARSALSQNLNAIVREFSSAGE